MFLLSVFRRLLDKFSSGLIRNILVWLHVRVFSHSAATLFLNHSSQVDRTFFFSSGVKVSGPAAREVAFYICEGINNLIDNDKRFICLLLGISPSITTHSIMSFELRLEFVVQSMHKLVWWKCLYHSLWQIKWTLFVPFGVKLWNENRKRKNVALKYCWNCYNTITRYLTNESQVHYLYLRKHRTKASRIQKKKTTHTQPSFMLHTHTSRIQQILSGKISHLKRFWRTL